ncbi:putative Lung seven transmembrane receptor [Helianthus annuus]|nr:putative Lung seven transmembrane receptor [Helianthus annuus]
MRILMNIVTTFLLLLLFLFASPSTADIKSIKIQSDNRPLILFQKFGFTETGNITVTVSSVSIINSIVWPTDPTMLGFFLTSDQTLIQLLLEAQQNPGMCMVDSNFITLLFTFQHLSPPPQSSFNKSYPLMFPGEYSLFFANCNPESPVTMDVRIEMFNTDDGATNNYLSVGLTQLPSLYFIFSLIYLCFLGFWIFLCFNNQRCVHRVHLLMGALLVTKALSLFCAAAEKHYVKVTGTPHGWNVLFYIPQFINSVLLFTVIVLIGAGWPYLKPILLVKEKLVLMIVITLRVVANVASIVIDETGPFYKDWETWNQVFLFADTICCCAIIILIGWSFRSFSRTEGNAARNLKPLRLFYRLVVNYVSFTRIGVFVLKTAVAYEQQWVCAAAYEVVSLVFCLVMFYMFRPVEGNEYFVVDDEGEHEEAVEMVKG